MKKLRTLLIPISLAGLAHTQAAIVQYNELATFLGALTSPHVTTDFSSLAPGDHLSTTLTIFGESPATTLLLETRNKDNTFSGDNFWVSDIGDLDSAVGTSTTYSDQLRLTSAGGFYAIAANWFLGDIDDNYLAGSVVLTFSDNSTYTITSSSQSDSFRGFISDTPLTSVRIAPSDPTNVAGWATIDNLTTSVPEPSVVLVSGLGGLGLLLRRRRSA